MQYGKPIAFLSQALKGHNLSLSTYEKEPIAFVMAVKKWRPYLLGGRTFVTRLHKWISKLLSYGFAIEFRTGKTNKVADALSHYYGVDDEPGYPCNYLFSHSYLVTGS